MEYVDPPLMFNENYSYRGSMSKTMREHFKKLSQKFNRFTKILEIGSNDGVFLKNFNPAYAISVEPCLNFAKETIAMGYQTYPEFWTMELSEVIKKNEGKRGIIFSANCICHIPDLNDAFKAVENLLDDEGM